MKYELGDVLPAITKKFGEHLGRAKVAAQSWKNDEKMRALKALDEKFSAAKARANVEQWSINTAVHYNEWANFSGRDFESVVVAFRELLANFYCESCKLLIQVMPSRGELDAITCECGATHFTLVPNASRKGEAIAVAQNEK
jgi:hypothetical protein